MYTHNVLEEGAGRRAGIKEEKGEWGLEWGLGLEMGIGAQGLE